MSLVVVAQTGILAMSTVRSLSGKSGHDAGSLKNPVANDPMSEVSI
jgi:hypothetical protein